ncbi:formamidopyrimidine-DNA glycosylase [Advenella faeciporci]|uniref:Formamidopyrimidine-DNA glycosylase n=1 Tax=Advenella faeciporci TaxID=797535 RepID=A0A918N0A7_9BURK|nr:bifunctional DNA-formamidopyrimidine glycosylase/DNA-(apurinic or apyrimidinic site) lyase [Advenella faeciporci]GGW88722.1 formamidopyrimidine-DNA glycosylase [Advenella faeciporci]
MPELPEVETTRRGLDSVITGHQLNEIRIHHHQFRWPIPENLNQILQGHVLQACERRGKYLLLAFEHGVLIIHLGMSGSIRRVAPGEFLLKHDHVEFVFDNAEFRLNDPRRFGAVLWHPAENGDILNHQLLARLGIEPFDPQFTATYLHKALQDKKSAIKTVLLSGEIVVGVGNIYASESLFRARINPQTAAQTLSHARCKRLHQAILETLTAALESGGSTLKDYTGTNGEVGAYFAIHAAVYDKEGVPCKKCGTLIRKIIQGQRATYFCPKCQRY